ncbi:hypothetical protein DMUE_5486 [Dictyocoela muelleri]|nr:hypothetical protein DMUE_5486 [Dictyocoela muelleri]
MKFYFVGITVNDIKFILNDCINYLRKTIPNLQPKIIKILSNFCYERLITGSIDLKIYLEHNNKFNYVFTMIDYFNIFVEFISLKENILLHFQIFNKSFL